jgi:choline transport protein
MMLIPLVLGVCTSLNALAAASRQAWALSRDQALPFSSWFRKVSLERERYYEHPLTRLPQLAVIGTPVPINCILFSLVILVAIALINIGSTAALNTIFALLTGATSFSYALSILCILIKRLKGEQLPPTRFSMGKFAVPINIFAFAYVVTAAVASFFPVSLPVNAQDMNWSCVMFGGVFVIAVVDYLVRGRKHYVEPVRHLNKM